MAGLLGFYRRVPLLPAFALATLVAVIIALGTTFAGVFTLVESLKHFGTSDLGEGILVITAMPNILVPSFIVALTLLVKLRGHASWKTPTFAFLVAAAATWIWVGPFEVRFAPFVLGTGALAWAISCLMIRRNQQLSEGTRDQA